MQQITDTILMVRPARFGYDQETAASNAFQVNDRRLSPSEIEEQAILEFDAMVSSLRSKDIRVLVIDDTPSPGKPSAVFPNNWLTTHADGTLITYPLLAPNRRAERREAIINRLRKHFVVKRHIHLEAEESEQRYLEGTGSLILDRIHRIAYACRSDRTHPLLFRQFCDRMGYQGMLFDAMDDQGTPIYHTNVMMALGEDLAVVNLSAIPSHNEREKLYQSLRKTSKEIIEIDTGQMKSYAGNMLQVRSTEGEHYLVMSAQARESLRPEQEQRIRNHGRIIACPLKTTETYGGGSARCMMAEIFLPTAT